jgi:hypothetical protein
MQKRGGRAAVLLGSAPVGQIAGGDDQFRLQPLQQIGQRMLQYRVVARSEMEIRKVEDARIHRRSRLYSE